MPTVPIRTAPKNAALAAARNGLGREWQVAFAVPFSE